MVTRIALNGAAGRMGRLLLQGLLAADDLQFVAAMEHPHHPLIYRDVGTVIQAEPCGIPLLPLEPGVADKADVIIDFSLPEGTRRLLECVRELPLVVGTTGLDAATDQQLTTYARRAPVVAAPNFATGVAVLTELVRRAAASLEGFDVEIIEAHHRRKQDAPSGTALRLARTVADARRTDFDANLQHGRSGSTGERDEDEIGVHAVRCGDLVGRHEVLLAGPGENISLVHRATSREAFVQGAFRAARWVCGREPGRYGVAEVLGLAGGEEDPS